jgi:hypothetical protein
MRLWVLLTLTVGVGVLTWLSGQAKGPIAQVAKQHGWHTSYDTARAEARRTGKPLLVIFRCEP